MSNIKSHKDLIVWQKAVVLVVSIYKLTESFPKSEMFGLVSQMRRAAVSIPSNIAEGKGRGTRKDFAQFLITARGSGAELETQLLVAGKLGYVSNVDLDAILKELTEVMMMLNSLISKLKNLVPNT